MIRTLRVSAVELLRRPGLTKAVTAELDPADLEIDDPRALAPIRVDLSATSTIDGVLVAGTVTTRWTAECRRCAAACEVETTTEVSELYQFEITDDEAYVIDGDQIDLAPIVRQYALLEAPDDALCRDDCAGLCATCGADLNDGECDCSVEVLDPRWAALSDVVIDETDETP